MRNAVASVVADWTGIPVGRMVKNEIEEVLNLADILEQPRHRPAPRPGSHRQPHPDHPRPPRQPQARSACSCSRAPAAPAKPRPRLALAETLYGGEQNLITINMSEFQEAHTVSTLKGSPPGYVGYGEGGVLTEAVRRRPYSVVLLDEVEKAHPDVHEIFFQVFDKGWMEDGEGRYIDFKNTIILLTTNAGQDVIMNMCKDPDLLPNAEGLEKALRVPLTKVFPDALLNRLLVVPYYPISQEVLRRIIQLNLARVQKRVQDNHKVPFTYDPGVLESDRQEAARNWNVAPAWSMPWLPTRCCPKLGVSSSTAWPPARRSAGSMSARPTKGSRSLLIRSAGPCHTPRTIVPSPSPRRWARTSCCSRA